MCSQVHFLPVTISFSIFISVVDGGGEEGNITGICVVSGVGKSIVSSQLLMLASESLPVRRFPETHSAFPASVCNSLSLPLMPLLPDVQKECCFV